MESSVFLINLSSFLAGVMRTYFIEEIRDQMSET